MLVYDDRYQATPPGGAARLGAVANRRSGRWLGGLWRPEAGLATILHQRLESREVERDAVRASRARPHSVGVAYCAESRWRACLEAR